MTAAERDPASSKHLKKDFIKVPVTPHPTYLQISMLFNPLMLKASFGNCRLER